jgi:hypothetical protein
LFAFKNDPDGQTFSFSFAALIKTEILQQQDRIKISTMANENDEQFSFNYLTTSVNFCRFLKGVNGNAFTRVIAENYFQSLQQNLSCPMAKNLKIEVINCTVTDKFMPPMPVETSYKFSDDVVGKIKGTKGWVNMYSYDVYFHYKKNLFD